jgi:hypothetical protein
LILKIYHLKYDVGDFSCLSRNEIRTLYQKHNFKKGSIKYNFVNGNISDILASNTITENDVVQAASQFNLLEMASYNAISENGITIYKYDGTQGPRVALSSPAGTFFRNYLIFEGSQQTEKRQINCISEILRNIGIKQNIIDDMPTKPSEKEYIYKNGYTFINTGNLYFDEEKLDNEMINNLRVGIHWNTPMINNYEKTCQVYSSALPLGYYNQK